MGTVAEKLAYVAETKEQIMLAILGKGIAVPIDTPFRDYAALISEIVSGHKESAFFTLNTTGVGFKIPFATLHFDGITVKE